MVAGTIGLGGAIVKGIRARNQKRKADKINPVRPEMVRTNASKENEAMFRNMANSSRIPGQGYAENQIGSQTARATNAIQQTGGSTGEIINGLTQVDENAKRSTNDLAFQGAALNQQNKQLYGQVLNNVSEDQKDIFDYNKNQPFQTKQLRSQQLRGSGAQNINNGIDTLGDTASNLGVASGYRKAGRVADTSTSSNITY